MAKKQTLNVHIKEIREALKKDIVIIGKERTLKALKLGKLSKVYLASNCPKELRDDLIHYGKLANVELVDLEYDNEELGVFCKKQYFISVLGVKA